MFRIVLAIFVIQVSFHSAFAASDYDSCVAFMKEELLKVCKEPDYQGVKQSNPTATAASLRIERLRLYKDWVSCVKQEITKRKFAYEPRDSSKPESDNVDFIIPFSCKK